MQGMTLEQSGPTMQITSPQQQAHGGLDRHPLSIVGPGGNRVISPLAAR